MNKNIFRLLIIVLVSMILISCSKVDLADQEAIDSLSGLQIDKIVLTYQVGDAEVLELTKDDNNFDEIVKLSSSIDLKNKSGKKRFSGNVITTQFYANDDVKLMLEIRDGYIFVNAVSYKYKSESKNNVNKLEKILASYFELK